MLVSTANLPIFPGRYRVPNKVTLTKAPRKLLEADVNRRMVCVVNRGSLVAYIGVSEDRDAPVWTCPRESSIVLSNPVYTGDIYIWGEADGIVEEVFVTEFHCVES